MKYRPSGIRFTSLDFVCIKKHGVAKGVVETFVVRVVCRKLVVGGCIKVAVDGGSAVVDGISVVKGGTEVVNDEIVVVTDGCFVVTGFNVTVK